MTNTVPLAFDGYFYNIIYYGIIINTVSIRSIEIGYGRFSVLWNRSLEGVRVAANMNEWGERIDCFGFLARASFFFSFFLLVDANRIGLESVDDLKRPVGCARTFTENVRKPQCLYDKKTFRGCVGREGKNQLSGHFFFLF